MEYVLQTKNIVKNFGHKRAVDHASINIKRGEIYGFIGKNGAGKTTFMKMICGLTSPTSGEITIFGANGRAAAENRHRIGSLIESPGIYEDMTALQNLKCKSLALGVKKPHHEEELLELVGLANTGHKKVKNFSLGMKQRLGIALSMVGDPEFLVLDEPINGLDPQGIAELRTLFERLRDEKKVTIMISSHILEELYKIADTFCFINNGRVMEELSRQELEEKSSDYVKLCVDDAASALSILSSLNVANVEQKDAHTLWIYDTEIETGNVNKALVMGGVLVEQICIVSESLEKYYLGLTGGDGNA